MKKNLLKIPDSIRRSVARIDGPVAAGCAQWYTRQQLLDGLLQHLDEYLTEEGLSVPQSVVPRAEQGRYSKRNRYGKEIVRKDLPMEGYDITFESPNYGDWGKGSHTTSWYRERYRRDFDPPRELEIAIHCSNPEPGRNGYMIAFKVDEPLDPAAEEFDERLLYNLNLLQENAYGAGVEPAEADLEAYSATLRIGWEILPPGSREEALERLFQGRQPSQVERDVADARLQFFDSLTPRRTIIGTSGFRRYLGALLESDLVVFENPTYGNAIYVMYGDWEELSQKTRIDLLAGRCGDDFDRVVHAAGWEQKVRRLVEDHRAGAD